jgi:hypothetical protein
MRGSTTGNWDKPARDSHKDNWDRICGGLADMRLLAQVRLRWEYSHRYINEVLPLTPSTPHHLHPPHTHTHPHPPPLQ